MSQVHFSSHDLYDSETNERLNPVNVDLTHDEYEAAIQESLEAGAEGHIRLANGRRVYAR